MADVIDAIDGPVTITACSTDSAFLRAVREMQCQRSTLADRTHLSALGEYAIAELAADPPPPTVQSIPGTAVLHSHG